MGEGTGEIVKYKAPIDRGDFVKLVATFFVGPPYRFLPVAALVNVQWGLLV